MVRGITCIAQDTQLCGHSVVGAEVGKGRIEDIPAVANDDILNRYEGFCGDHGSNGNMNKQLENPRMVWVVPGVVVMKKRILRALSQRGS